MGQLGREVDAFSHSLVKPAHPPNCKSIDQGKEEFLPSVNIYLNVLLMVPNLNLTNLENASLKATVLGIGWCVKSS